MDRIGAGGMDGEEGEDALTRIVRELRQRMPLAMTYLGSSISLVTSSVLQLVTMAILARTLGVAQFGQFLTMTAMVTIAINFCGIGATEPLVRRVARDPAIYPRALGHNLILIAASGSALVVLLIGLMPLWVRVAEDATQNLVGIVIFVLANIFVLRIILFTEQVFIAHMEFTRANVVNVALAVTRCGSALVAAYVLNVTTLAGWIEVQAAGFVLLCAAVVLFGLKPLGRPEWRLMREEISQGLFFSTSWAVRTLKQTGDILVLGLVAPPAVVGAFGLSRRIVETSGLTLDALFRIMYPRLSQAMEPGMAAGLWLAKRILAAVVSIAILTAVALYVIAPLGPLLFGAQFESMIGYLHLMCWLLIPAAFTGTGAEVLGASSQHGVRATIYYGTVLGVALIGAMTYFFSVPGTIASLYLVEISLAAAFWTAIWRIARRTERAAPQPAAVASTQETVVK